VYDRSQAGGTGEVPASRYRPRGLKAGTVGLVDSHRLAFPVPFLFEASAREEAINSASSFWLNGKTLGKITLSLFAKKYYTPLIFRHLAYGH
jgi:hypothetical protein